MNCSNLISMGRYSTSCTRTVKDPEKLSAYGDPLCNVCFAAQERGKKKQAESARLYRAKWDRIEEKANEDRLHREVVSYIRETDPEQYEHLLEIARERLG